MFLDGETPMELYCDAAQQLATSEVTTAVAEGLAVGRLTALLKDNGGWGRSLGALTADSSQERWRNTSEQCSMELQLFKEGDKSRRLVTNMCMLSNIEINKFNPVSQGGRALSS